VGFGFGESTKKRKAIQKAAKRMAKPMVKAGKRPGKTRVHIDKVGKRRYRAVVFGSTKPTPRQKSIKKGTKRSK
jgi:hypothetical protein